jgi:hypothetical protein
MDEETRTKYAKMNPVVLILMKDDEDWVDFGELKKWEGEADARELVEGVVNRDLEAFGSFMEGHTGDPLARPERAIIKTYLAWKLGLHQEQAENA